MTKRSAVTVGLDISDRYTHACELAEDGSVMARERIRTQQDALQAYLAGRGRLRIALEVGPHSPWMSRAIEALGHETIVANPRRLRLIYENDRKRDPTDAELLARVARLDPTLLAPILHRSQRAQEHLAVVQSRDQVVRARTALINHVRGTVKALGGRLPSRSATGFHRLTSEDLPEGLRPALAPVLALIGSLTAQIRQYDRDIIRIADELYPESKRLRQVRGVGALTALTYMLVVQSPARFRRSREVGPYLGLVPRKDQSGDIDRELHITKAGNPLLRRLLVHAAHYILGPFGAECDLRRWGHTLAAHGGKGAKKRAVTAVARKLAVLLHHLWRVGDVYEPVRKPQPSV